MMKKNSKKNNLDNSMNIGGSARRRNTSQIDNLNYLGLGKSKNKNLENSQKNQKKLVRSNTGLTPQNRNKNSHKDQKQVPSRHNTPNIKYKELSTPKKHKQSQPISNYDLLYCLITQAKVLENEVFSFSNTNNNQQKDQQNTGDGYVLPDYPEIN